MICVFQWDSGQRGCQDARELLRYEAVVVEEALHQTLVEINETQSLLEEGRVQAAARYCTTDRCPEKWQKHLSRTVNET